MRPTFSKGFLANVGLRRGRRRHGFCRDYVVGGNRLGPRVSERDLSQPTGKRHDAKTCCSDDEDKLCGSGRIGN